MNPGGKPQLHYSNLSTLSQCGQKFEFRSVKGIRMAPTAYLHVGKAVDASANQNLQRKIDTDTLMEVEEAVTIARDSVNRNIENEGLTVLPGESEQVEKAAAIDKTVRLARTHAKILAPKLKPKRVQSPWTLEIPGLPFDVVGTRDLDDTDNRIHDLKTSAKSPNRTAAETSMQLSMYALSVHVIEKVPTPIAVAIDAIVDLKRDTKYVALESERDKDDFRALANRLENAAKALESGVFVPTNPERDPLCSIKYCEFHSICPYVRKPRTLNLGGVED